MRLSINIFLIAFINLSCAGNSREDNAKIKVVTEKISNYYSEQPSHFRTVIKSYDELGVMKEKKELSHGNPDDPFPFKVTYYNERELEIKKLIGASENVLKLDFEYIYEKNKKDEVVRYIQYSDNSTSSKEVIIYDGDQIISKTQFNINGEIHSQDKYYYNNGLLDSVVQINNIFKSRLTVVYNYDSKDQIINIAFKDKNGSESISYHYNEQGNVDLEKKYMNKVLVDSIEFKYKYDDYGNWVEKEEIIRGHKVRVYKREYTYY